MILTTENNRFLKQVFVSLETLDYCVLRNYDTLPKEVGKDIDILISFESVIDAVSRVQSLALEQAYNCQISDNELNGFNLIVLGKDQKINIHFQLWVSFETNIIYKYVPGLSEKITKAQVDSKDTVINECLIKIPKELDELLLLLRQLEFKSKKSYEQRVLTLVNNSENIIVNDAIKYLKLDSEGWVTASANRTKLISRLIWKVWKKSSLKNFFQATIFVIRRKY
jgi:hypothetical protein